MLNSKILKTCKEILESLKETSFLRGGEIESINGSYHCDCSSFINSILKIVNSSFYSELLGDRQRLRACDYYDLCIEDNGRVQCHQNISKLSPGEVILWRKLNPPKSGDTGHLAVVLEEPVLVSPGKWKVLVSDSSKTLHDNDSRSDSGVGFGEMYLLEENDLITGYIWSTKVSKNKLSDVLCMSFH